MRNLIHKKVGIGCAWGVLVLCGLAPVAGSAQDSAGAEAIRYKEVRGNVPGTLLPAASAGMPDSVASMSLDKMIALVGERDPRVLVSELSARAAYERAAKAWAGHYPQGSISYVAGREGSRNAQPGGGGTSSSANADTFHGGQANLNWEIYAWGATQKRYQEAFALAQAEEERFRRAWDLIIMEAIDNYLNMYRLRQQLEITRQTLVGHAKLLKIVEDRVGARLAPEARRSDALLRVQEVMADREDILSQLDEVNTTYRTLTGLEPPVNLADPQIAKLYQQRLACLSFDENVRLAYSVHPQIRANLLTIEAAGHAVEGMKAERLPKLNAFARYNSNRLLSTEGSTLPYSGRGYQVGLNLTWNFVGNAYGNTIAERIYLKEKSEVDNERALRETERNIHIAREALASAQGRTAILAETLRLSDEVLAQRQQSFAVQTMSDEAVNALSNAYYSRARAATALLNLRMRQVVASYTLVESSGLMNEVFPLPLSVRGAIGPAPVRHFAPGATAGMNPDDGLPAESDVVRDLLMRKVNFKEAPAEQPPVRPEEGAAPAPAAASPR